MAPWELESLAVPGEYLDGKTLPVNNKGVNFVSQELAVSWFPPRKEGMPAVALWASFWHCSVLWPAAHFSGWEMATHTWFFSKFSCLYLQDILHPVNIRALNHWSSFLYPAKSWYGLYHYIPAIWNHEKG